MIPDSDPNDDIDNNRTETTLTITGKTAEEMRTFYGFTPFQNETMDLLLSDTAMLKLSQSTVRRALHELRREGLPILRVLQQKRKNILRKDCTKVRCAA